MSEGSQGDGLELFRQDLFTQAYRFPDGATAKAAWEEAADRTDRPEVTISVFRGRLPHGTWFVVAIGLDAGPVQEAAEIMAETGNPIELPPGILQRFLARAVRVGGLGRGAVRIRARHGRAGAVISSNGVVRPRRRPKG